MALPAQVAARGKEVGLLTSSPARYAGTLMTLFGIKIDAMITHSDGYAGLLEVNQQTVRNWIDRGELAALRVGSRRVRVRRIDLDAYSAASREGARSRRTGTRDDACEALEVAMNSSSVRSPTATTRRCHSRSESFGAPRTGSAG